MRLTKRAKQCIVGLIACLGAPALLSAEPDPTRKVLEEAERALKIAPTAANHLTLAEVHRDLVELDQALEHYRLALAGDASPSAEQSYIEYLLALGLFDQAGEALDMALVAHPGDGVLLESRAALAAALDDSATAVKFLEQAWDAGRDPLAWLDRGRLHERLREEPYRSLLDDELLLLGIEDLELAARERRLNLLAETLTEKLAPTLVNFLVGQADAEILRKGIRALRRLDAPQPYIGRLLSSDVPQARRAGLNEIWQTRDSAYLPTVQALTVDEDPGNADLAEVIVAVLSTRDAPLAQTESTLDAVHPQNVYRHLGQRELARRYRAAGESEKAAALNAELAALKPRLAAARKLSGQALAGYWECMERTDLREISALLSHHRYQSKIDARIYGLPEHDFDDQQHLTISERLFLRAQAREQGRSMLTSGTMQYHREAGHFLRKTLKATGSWLDCSGFLRDLAAEPPVKALEEDGGEVKVLEDTSADNEVNIVVNPNDPRYVILTSNDFNDVDGTDLYRTSDWGKTWTGGDIVSSLHDLSGIDPITYYTRTEVNGTPTDVAYHSRLVEIPVKIGMLYSTDNGASWSACESLIGYSADRQDHVVDTNPESSCYNTIYVGYLGHRDDEQRFADNRVSSSTGTTFPYCQTWNEHGTKKERVLGNAMVVSTNGIAHNLFMQHGPPGGLHHSHTTDCGGSWSDPEKISEIFNVGGIGNGFPAVCDRQPARFPQGDSDRQSSSVYKNNIYVIWGDLSGECEEPGREGNTTCNGDLYLMVGVPDDRENPTGWTWAYSNLTDGFSDDYTDEFHPSLTVDQADGSIYISYYRTNSGAGGSIIPRQTQVHYVMTRSIDGGQTWETPYQITDQPTDESDSKNQNGTSSRYQFGDYTWNDVIDGVMYGAWTDRREGADEDIWAVKMCSPPAHWSERAPSFSAPATTATGAGDTSYTISWATPDIYWGDGGENNSARKFQLVVDDSVVEDNMSWNATSTTYDAGDTASHTAFIRAVNQCGTSKDYASTTLSGGGGGGTMTFTSIAAEDGWIRESGDSNTGDRVVAGGAGGSAVRVGDDKQDRQLRSILSFDTSDLPDGAVIVRATLKLRRGTVQGEPFSSLGKLRVDIKTGDFSSDGALQSQDFQASADARAANVSNVAAPSVKLNARGRNAINTTGKTQIRLRFVTDDDDDGINDFVGFHPGDSANAAKRPVLEIEYQ